MLSIISLAQTFVVAVQAAIPPYLGDAAGAGSPLGEFAFAAIVQVLLIGFLAVTLVGGGILIINLTMMSRRPQDWTGSHRDPSNLGFFKHETWPQEPYDENILPAKTEEEEAELEKRSRPPDHAA